MVQWNIFHQLVSKIENTRGWMGIEVPGCQDFGECVGETINIDPTRACGKRMGSVQCDMSLKAHDMLILALNRHIHIYRCIYRMGLSICMFYIWHRCLFMNSWGNRAMASNLIVGRSSPTQLPCPLQVVRESAWKKKAVDGWSICSSGQDLDDETNCNALALSCVEFCWFDFCEPYKSSSYRTKMDNPRLASGIYTGGSTAKHAAKIGELCHSDIFKILG